MLETLYADFENEGLMQIDKKKLKAKIKNLKFVYRNELSKIVRKKISNTRATGAPLQFFLKGCK
jgi:hypothetical protein